MTSRRPRVTPGRSGVSPSGLGAWIARLRRISGSEWRAFFGALPLVVRVRLALWTTPFERVRSTYAPAPVGPNVGPAESAAVAATASAVNRAAKLVPDASCLTRALTLATLLSRQGIGCSVEVGVRKSPRGDLEAHAWVVHDGRVVIGNLPDLSTFSVIPKAFGNKP